MPKPNPIQPNQPTMPNPALQQSAPLPAPRRSQPQRNAAPQRPAPPPAPAPNRAVPPAPQIPRPQSVAVAQLPTRHEPRRTTKAWWLLLLIPLLLIATLGAGALGLGVVAFSAYNNGILPAVSVSGVRLGGYSQAEAVNILNETWRTVVLRDGERTWRVSPSDIGLTLDAVATAEQAYAQGRGAGDPISALIGGSIVAPVANLDATAAYEGLNAIAYELSIDPVNAGVTLVNGQAQPTVAQNGRAIDLQATLASWQQNLSSALADGTLELQMVAVAPSVTDSSPLVAEAQRLLQNPLDIRIFDPVTGDSVYWSVAPETWGNWLTASANPSSPIGLSLSADENALRNYLSQQSAQTFDTSRSVDIEAGIASIQSALANGQPANAYLTVKHAPRTYTVQAGETITSIAWDFGIPYLYIMQMNGGIESVSAGQEITLPAADSFLFVPPVANKRIVVSISQQRVWVYENGQVKWEWAASTGISSSPTWPGVYQIISHEPNAYAGNWNLYMPNFMGVYRPIPGAEFTNGFHGFPTRGGGQLLWENSIGTKVTYGCILLNNTNIKLLYDWAEEGVVVEIKA